jgi:hypothetical protein
MRGGLPRQVHGREQLPRDVRGRRRAPELRDGRDRMRTVLRLRVALALTATLSASPAAGASASASGSWEIEPHLVFGASAPWFGGGYGAGVGARAALTLGSFGVSSRVRDAIALSFGLDLVRGWGGSPFGVCVERTPGPAGTSVCTRVDAPNGAGGFLLVPVVARWTLEIAPPFSVFIEPGVAMFVASDHGGATGAFALGGRMRLGETAEAVVRLGWPASTLGLAF